MDPLSPNLTMIITKIPITLKGSINNFDLKYLIFAKYTLGFIGVMD